MLIRVMTGLSAPPCLQLYSMTETALLSHSTLHLLHNKHWHLTSPRHSHSDIQSHSVTFSDSEWLSLTNSLSRHLLPDPALHWFSPQSEPECHQSNRKTWLVERWRCSTDCSTTAASCKQSITTPKCLSDLCSSKYCTYWQLTTDNSLIKCNIQKRPHSSYLPRSFNALAISEKVTSSFLILLNAQLELLELCVISQ